MNVSERTVVANRRWHSLTPALARSPHTHARPAATQFCGDPGVCPDFPGLYSYPRQITFPSDVPVLTCPTRFVLPPCPHPTVVAHIAFAH